MNKLTKNYAGLIGLLTSCGFILAMVLYYTARLKYPELTVFVIGSLCILIDLWVLFDIKLSVKSKTKKSSNGKKVKKGKK